MSLYIIIFEFLFISVCVQLSAELKQLKEELKSKHLQEMVSIIIIDDVLMRVLNDLSERVLNDVSVWLCCVQEQVSSQCEIELTHTKQEWAEKVLHIYCTCKQATYVRTYCDGRPHTALVVWLYLHTDIVRETETNQSDWNC